MSAKPRPWATIIVAVLALVGALYVEFAGWRPPPAGVTFLAAAPTLALAYVLDWIRPTRPPARKGLVVFALAVTALATPAALMFPLGRTMLAGTALAFGALIFTLHLRARWLRRVVDATYVGERGGRSVFVRQEACWVMKCDDSFSMRPGDAVAFRFRGARQSAQGSGPFRSHAQFEGRIVEIASSRESLRARRELAARWLTKCTALAALAVVAQLAVLSVFFVLFVRT